MFIVESYSLAVVMCIITMLCWGSWANTQKLASKEWRFQLFYWDYAIGVFLLALGLAFTLGSTGSDGRPFLADLRQAEGKWLGSAFLGGVIFNLSNILLVAAIDIAGLGRGLSRRSRTCPGAGRDHDLPGEANGHCAHAGPGRGQHRNRAILLDALAYKRLGGSGGGSYAQCGGIVISVAAGLLMGWFYSFRRPVDGQDRNSPRRSSSFRSRIRRTAFRSRWARSSP